MLMRKMVILLVCALGAGAWSAGVARAEEGAMAQLTQTRDQVQTAHKWKVEDMYASPADWEKDLVRLKADLKKFEGCKGKLGQSAARLAACLDSQFSLTKRYYLLSGYASRVHDQDMAGVKGQELYERITKVGTELKTAAAFVEPEILAIPPKKLAGFRKAKALADYLHYLDNITRRRAHVLTQAEEQLVARTGDMAAMPTKIYQTFSTLNLPFEEVTLKDGKKVKLSQAMYTKFRSAPDRADRIKVFQSVWKTYSQFRETYAGLLSGVVSRDHFYAQARKYDSDLAAALDATNVPTSIYTNMIEQVRAGRPLLWRYLKLRKKLLGLSELGYHDLYCSIVPAVEMKVDWQQARAILLDALTPLGEPYLKIMRKAIDERWTDVYPTKGKRSGAYMSGAAYDVHPFVLLNYNDDYESLSTAAHEYGHAGHSYLSNKTQKFHNAQYPIFAAEVASTTNENLLRLKVYAKETDPQKKLFLVGQHLERWRQTVFRQCLFAEFELKIHDLAAAGTPLTADLLDETYLKLLREYYGEAEGVVKIDPAYAVEWAYIPHFYYNFYMFQYTTSFIASMAIAQKIYDKDEKARDAYLQFLSAGGSLYPVDLLKLAGVDMTTAEPYQVAFKALEQALDEAEALTR